MKILGFARSLRFTRRTLASSLATALTSRLAEGEIAPGSAQQRRTTAFEVRRQAALRQMQRPLVEHRSNGDEQDFPGFVGAFTKGLPHNSLGEVDLAAYWLLSDALADPVKLNDAPLLLGCLDASQQRALVNPQAAFAYELSGAESHSLTMPPAPKFSSPEAGGEMVELYWQSVLRDTPFEEYESSLLAQEAAAELSTLSDFRGPREGGFVTPGTLFRGSAPGDLVGPYLSQFLLKGTPFGAQFIEQRLRCPRPNVDFGIEFDEWLDLQRGCEPLRRLEFDSPRRYIRDGRNLAQWVHLDTPVQAYLNAALILSTHPDAADEPTGGGMGAPFSTTHPYHSTASQEGFVTFGVPYILELLCSVAICALKAVWFQKWGVHRRLRPEAFGGRLQWVMDAGADYPVPKELISSQAVKRSKERTGSWLLPLAYPEGSPLHPSYGAGHAAVAGACVTALKALFDESFPIPNPVEPSTDGTNLIPYVGADAGRLTVGENSTS